MQKLYYGRYYRLALKFQRFDVIYTNNETQRASERERDINETELLKI